MTLRHYDLITLAGVQTLLDQEGAGYDLHKLKTAACLKSHLNDEVFADCDHEYTDLKARLEAWINLSDDQKASISVELDKEAERAGREALELLLLGYPQRDMSLLLLDVIDGWVARFTGGV